jgi:hypothetical protein
MIQAFFYLILSDKRSGSLMDSPCFFASPVWPHR